MILVSNLLELNDKTGINKSGQTIKERMADFKEDFKEQDYLLID